MTETSGRQAGRALFVAYGWAVLAVAVTTAVAWQFVPHDDPATLIMVYLLAVVLVASRFGKGAPSWAGPSVATSVLSVAAFDFFFVPPIFTFVVNDLRYLFTFATMLLVALVISSLTARTKRQAEQARARERRTAALYALSRELTSAIDQRELARVAARHIADVFDSPAFVLLADAEGALALAGAAGGAAQIDEDAARSAFRSPSAAALDHLARREGADSAAMYAPLVGARGPIGVVGVAPPGALLLDRSRREQLETFANQTAIAIERALLAEEAARARLEAEAERLQSSLLSSVSHDLRTPLAAITGALSTLLDDAVTLGEDTRRELLTTAYGEADRLGRLVRDLLDMTRLEGGAARLATEWAPLEEIVGSSLGRLDAQLAGRNVDLDFPASLPLVRADAVLLGQVFVNLVENALKYTPEGSPLSISARTRGGGDALGVEVTVADRGPGVCAADATRVFEKFYRASGAKGGGVGLGLAICRAVVVAHGGRIWAENREGGGASFSFTLPVAGAPLPCDEEERA